MQRGYVSISADFVKHHLDIAHVFNLQWFTQADESRWVHHFDRELC